MAADHEAQPDPPKRPRLAWSRGRWALLALAALVAGHWYVSRSTATETAARLHGAASQFAACVAGARPPDPGAPEARRALEAMLFKRLALSLSQAKPLATCAPLALTVRAQAQIHGDNFYRRSPNEVETIETIAERLATFDYEQPALALSKKPGAGAESPTLGLIGDTNRLLELTCRVAQAEKAYDTGACPLTGEEARGVPDPRLALEVSLGEPIADYRMTLGASPAPRLVVAARGRRTKFGSWVAGAYSQPGSPASWRTLSLVAPETAAAPPGRELPYLALSSSDGGSSVSQSFTTAGRAYRTDSALSKATPVLAVDTEAGSPTTQAPTISRIVTLPHGGHVWIRTESSEGVPPTSTRVTYYDAEGKQLSSRTLAGSLLSAMNLPPRLILRAAGLESVRLELLDGEPPPPVTLYASGDESAPFTLLESQERCGGSGLAALLGRTGQAATLVRLPDEAPAQIQRWNLAQGTRPSLVCGACTPRILEVTQGKLSLRDLETKKTQSIDTPVLFGANSAIRTEAACVERTTVLAYIVGGALLVQRVTPEGSEAPIEVARPGEQGNTTQPQFLLLPAQDREPPRLLVFWRRAGGKTRSDVLRIEFAESTDVGVTWH